MANGLTGYLSKINPFKKEKIKYLDDEGRPQTVVRTGKKKGLALGGSGRNKGMLNAYWQYYRKEGTVWAAINSIAYNTVMVGYHIESDNLDARKLIETWCRKVNLDEHLLSNTVYALVLGDAFIEIVSNRKGSVTRLKDVDPKTMEIEDDKYGIVQGYLHKVGMAEPKKIKKEIICHIKLFSDPTEQYGISIIEPNKEAIDRMIRSDQSISNATIRHGTTKTVFTVGTEKDGQIPPIEVLEKIEKEVEDIDEKNELIVPWNVKVSTIDESGVPGVEQYFKYFQSKVVIGLLCPEEALGLGTGGTEATSKVKALLYERMIKSFQMRLAKIVEEQLFNKVLESEGYDPDIVSIKFRGITDEDEAMKAKWMGNFIRGFRSSKYKPLTINEMRREMGFKPLDVPEANTIIYEGFEGEDKQVDEEDNEDEETEPEEKKPEEETTEIEDEEEDNEK